MIQPINLWLLVVNIASKPSTFLLLFNLLLVSLVTTGCQSFGPIRVHKVVIQQGNVINAAMIKKLWVGMTKEQAQFVLGQTLLQHVFDQDRWDYIYRLQVPSTEPVEFFLTLYFSESELTRFDSNVYSPKNEPSSPQSPTLQESTTELPEPAAGTSPA